VAEKSAPSGPGEHQRSFSGRAAANQANLADSLAALADMAYESAGLTDLLTRVAELAVQAIPGADGAGLTLLEVDRADLIVKSEAFVRAIDDIQYGIGEGPCISAAATGQTKRSGELGIDPRWPLFGPRASALGVHSALSLPLVVTTGILGAMNVYAHAPDSFDNHSQNCGETFAISAALAVQNAQIIDQTTRFVGQLETGLKGRGLIDQAVGILRRRLGVSAGEALGQLKEMSDSQEIPLVAAASSVLKDAVRRRQADDSTPSVPDGRG